MGLREVGRDRSGQRTVSTFSDTTSHNKGGRKCGVTWQLFGGFGGMAPLYCHGRHLAECHLVVFQVCTSDPSQPPALRLIQHGKGSIISMTVSQQPDVPKEKQPTQELSFKLVSDTAGDFGFFVIRRDGECESESGPRSLRLLLILTVLIF